jgi:hypothetical protein
MMSISLFPSTKDEHAVDMMAFNYNFQEDRRRFDHDHSITVPEQDRAFRNDIQIQRAKAKREIIALAKQRNVDPSIAIWMLRGHGKIEEQEKPPPVVGQLRKPPKKRRRLSVFEEHVRLVVVQPPIILASLQRRGTDPVVTYPDAPPIAPETAIEILHRENWTARDLAIRNRRNATSNLNRGNPT